MKKSLFFSLPVVFCMNLLLNAGGPPPPPTPPPFGSPGGLLPTGACQPGAATLRIVEEKWPAGTIVKTADAGDLTVEKNPQGKLTGNFQAWLKKNKDCVPRNTIIKLPNGTELRLGYQWSYTKWAQSQFDPNFTLEF